MNRKAVLCVMTRMLLTLVSIMLLSVVYLQAQVDTGSILGTVSDPSGAVLSGAKVTLTNEGTSASLTTTTEADGSYKFTPVKIGMYKLDATTQGFGTVSQNHITVAIDASPVINFTLKPGSTTETIEVTAAAPVLQTQEASVGQVIDQRGVNNLPLNGRNFTFLAQLAAGVNSAQADTRGNAASGAFSANGNRPSQNNYMLDGIDNNSDTVDFLNGTNYVVLPPVDAIQEFKVQTTDFSAEYGRSGAAILNATIKSGTNEFHGAAWEFFRNDKLDAADYFERRGNATTKGEFRLNQFGAAIGGPVFRNKVFFFGDYEGTRRRQGSPHFGTVPTALERSSGYTNFQEIITGQITGIAANDTQTDALGRTMPTGTILDPATTRQTSPGVFVRDPFGTCPASTANYTLATCNLNIIPAGRLDPNAIKLLNLYPGATTGQLKNNFADSPVIKEKRNAFDTRLDLNISDKNQVFARFSLVDDPIFIPSVFGGIADAGGFSEGSQTALAQQSALAWTHVFSPTTVNVARAGLNYLHTTRAGPSASTNGLPAQFGIQGIPQGQLNGGIPSIGITGLSDLGGFGFLPSNEVSSTIQATDDFTKIYKKHTFKMGIEYQHVKFSTLQPPWSRGRFVFDGNFTNIPGAGASTESTGIAQFLLTPTASTVGGPNYVGGPGSQGHNNDAIIISNISLTDNGKNYTGTYLNDDWKVTSKLTLNLGLRYDFFGLVYEHHGNEGNFVPRGAPTNTPLYLLPGKTSASSLSPSFISLLAKDGIGLDITNKYGKGLGHSQKYNFAPRLGFAYQVTPKLVARGGFGIFYNGFENRGFSPNLGENYPFQFNFNFRTPADDSHPYVYTGCTSPAATPGGGATLETGFSCTPLDPALVNAQGLQLRGIQFDYKTPYTLGGNFTVQYQLTPTMSVQAGYVTSEGRHLEVFPNSNNVTSISPTATRPFPDFGQGASYAITEGSSSYHGLQTKVEKQFADGLNFLFTYTLSRARTDAIDLLNNDRNNQGYRAPDVPGFGIKGEYGLADFDIRNVFHFSGSYELPFGKGKRYMGEGKGFGNALVGGWSLNWVAVVQGGQPITLACPQSTSPGVGCFDLLTGQSTKLGLHNDANGKLSFYGNPGAFTQPCPSTGTGPAGCVPETGLGLLGGHPAQIIGPPFRRLDLSLFKDFRLSERFTMQFRSEFFNVLNHPNFNAPNLTGNGGASIAGAGNYLSSSFGEIGSTRDAPNDPRQIQFALKLYF